MGEDGLRRPQTRNLPPWAAAACPSAARAPAPSRGAHIITMGPDANLNRGPNMCREGPTKGMHTAVQGLKAGCYLLAAVLIVLLTVIIIWKLLRTKFGRKPRLICNVTFTGLICAFSWFMLSLPLLFLGEAGSLGFDCTESEDACTKSYSAFLSGMTSLLLVLLILLTLAGILFIIFVRKLVHRMDVWLIALLIELLLWVLGKMIQEFSSTGLCLLTQNMMFLGLMCSVWTHLGMALEKTLALFSRTPKRTSHRNVCLYLMGVFCLVLLLIIILLITMGPDANLNRGPNMCREGSPRWTRGPWWRASCWSEPDWVVSAAKEELAQAVSYFACHLPAWWTSRLFSAFALACPLLQGAIWRK